MTTWWQFMNQLKPILCKHYGTYRVYYAYLIVWTFLYLWIYLFLFLFPPTSVAFLGHVLRNFCCDWMAIAILGRCCELGCTIFIAFIWRNFLLHPPPSIKYCTYTIIISSGITEALNSWVSRSKKCPVKERQYLVFLGTP